MSSLMEIHALFLEIGKPYSFRTDSGEQMEGCNAKVHIDESVVEIKLSYDLGVKLEQKPIKLLTPVTLRCKPAVLKDKGGKARISVSVTDLLPSSEK